MIKKINATNIYTRNISQNCGGNMNIHIDVQITNREVITQKLTNLIAYRVNFIMRCYQISNCAPADGICMPLILRHQSQPMTFAASQSEI